MTFDPRRHGLPLAALWWLVITAAILALRPLTPVDETRYLTVAWDMHQTGDWISLKLNGDPYGHKPPLLFWLVHIGWSVFGLSLWWPRLMLAAFAIGALFLTHRLARRMVPGNEPVAAMTVLITASALYWMGFTAAVMFDIMLAFFVLLAISAVVSAAQGGGGRAWAVAGLALGGGILTKGPVVLLHVLPVAVLAPWWLRRPPSRWRAWYGGIVLAVVIGAAIALAWAVPAALAAGAHFGKEIFWSQSAGRMVGGAAPHARPAWFYLAGLPLLVWPWLLWPTLWRGLAALRGAEAPGVRFALAWGLPPVLGFTAIAGKQFQYLLPLVPALALLAASGLSALGRSSAVPVSRRGAVLPALAYLGLAAGAVWYARQPATLELLGPADVLTVAAGITVAGFVIAAGVVLLASRRAPATAVAVISAASVISAIGFMSGMGRAYLAPRDLQPVADVLAQAEPQPIAQLGKYHGDYHFLGRLRRPIEVIGDVERMYRWAAANPDGRVIVRSRAPMVHRDGKQPLISQRYMGRLVNVWRGADFAGVAPDSIKGRVEQDDGASDE